MGTRATILAVLLALGLWALVWVTRPGVQTDQTLIAPRLADIPADISGLEIRVSGSDRGAWGLSGESQPVVPIVLNSTKRGWDLTWTTTEGPHTWRANEEAIRSILRVVATSDLESLEGQPDPGTTQTAHPQAKATGLEAIVTKTDGSTRSLRIANERAGGAYAGLLDGRPVRVPAQLAQTLTPSTLMSARDTLAFVPLGSWRSMMISDGTQSLGLVRTDGHWGLAPDADATTDPIRLDSKLVEQLIAGLLTLRADRLVDAPDSFPESGVVELVGRDVDAQGNIIDATQRMTIGPQADLAGERVLARLERGSGTVYGELLTTEVPPLPTDPGALLDRRATDRDPTQIVSISLVPNQTASPDTHAPDQDSSATAHVVSREGESWSGAAGTLMRPESAALTALASTLSKPAESARLKRPDAQKPAPESLGITYRDGSSVTLGLSAEDGRVVLSSGDVEWLYGGDDALAIAKASKLIAQVGG